MIRLPQFPKRIRDLSFWHYQLAGWLIVMAFYWMTNLAIRDWKPTIFLSISLQVGAGFFLTTLLRYYYRTIRYQELTLFSIVMNIAAGAAIVTIAWFGLFLWIEYALFGIATIHMILTPLSVLSIFAYSLPDKLAWCVLYFTIKFWRDWLDEQDRSEVAVLEAQQTQFQMLRYQLNPEFLFESLNSINRAIDMNTEKAKGIVTDLSEYLRYALVSKHRPLVPLSDELNALQLFFTIDQERLSTRLDIVIETDDTARSCLIPAFTLPLIAEYALNGLPPHGSTVRPIRIEARLQEHRKLKIVLTHQRPHLSAKEVQNRQEQLKQIETHLRSIFRTRFSLSEQISEHQADILFEFNCLDGARDEKNSSNHHR